MQQSHPQPIRHVTDPMVTGSSIIALKFNGGVVLACDSALSYGSTISTSLATQSSKTRSASHPSPTIW